MFVKLLEFTFGIVWIYVHLTALCVAKDSLKKWTEHSKLAIFT
jgi:hypothetical protein